MTQLPLKAGHYRPARLCPCIECWLGSVVISRGSGPVLLRNPIGLCPSGVVGTPCLLSPTLSLSLDPRMVHVGCAKQVHSMR